MQVQNQSRVHRQNGHGPAPRLWGGISTKPLLAAVETMSAEPMLRTSSARPGETWRTGRNHHNGNWAASGLLR